ncbi:hypothetical protein WK90_23035 [Burkholderia cepacia]|nr:hypothetical protein WK83_26205 [Burkholderia cepacia]KVV62606.1 hypothetical protein WK85_05325 [Burkholderia cepacia]KVV68000.1 hypothetical protein WK84_20945 [Burkholderia cepacia]KVV75527.1 hypothetical protein WK86_29210 [Burkholderia cepacia]KVV79188.1 hypothetical protein WK87_29145 [Burkholderia cepacia]
MDGSACCLLCAELLTSVLAAAYGCFCVDVERTRKSDRAASQRFQQVVLWVHYRRTACVLQNVPLVLKFETEAGDISLGAGQISS